MTVQLAGESIDSILAQLRAEEPLEPETAQRALLRHEIARLELKRGNQEVAFREWLAAVDTDPSFREPLEALIQHLRGRGDDASVPKLLEALVANASDGESLSRALWELANYQRAVQNDRHAARATLERAVEANSADAIAWLELELLAVQSADLTLRARAIEARSRICSDVNHQGILLIELARIRAARGDVGQAVELLDSVLGLESRARYRSRLVLEQLAVEAQDMELQALALEGQAELISLALRDAAAGAAHGVPSIDADSTVAGEAWLRAGELRRRSGDVWGAMAALNSAAEQLGGNPMVARLQMSAARAADDHDAVSRLAREQIASGATGSVASAMWLQLALGAAAEDEHEKALFGCGKALEFESSNQVALNLQRELLLQSGDHAAVAETIKAQAQHTRSDVGRIAKWVSLAHHCALVAEDTDGAKAALAEAVEAGADAVEMARTARILASGSGELDWLDEATVALLGHELSTTEHVTTCLELGRSRLRWGDENGAATAFAMLEGDGQASRPWLARMLAAYAVRIGGGREGDANALWRAAELESDDELARGMGIVAAALANRGTDDVRAERILKERHAKHPNDVVVALFLADLRRGMGNRKGAAETLEACAQATGDDDLSAAMHLESGFLLWHADERQAALAAFKAGREHAPEAASLALAWALRSLQPNDKAAREQALDCDEERGGGTGVWLERLGLALADSSSGPMVLTALSEIEREERHGDLALAVALVRLAWRGDSSGGEEQAHALERVAGAGEAGQLVAAAERFRVARFVERNGATALSSARAWAESERGLGSALEWLSAALSQNDSEQEIAARQFVAEQFEGVAREQLLASAAMVRMAARPAERGELLAGETAAAHLSNLELAPPGSDPVRRAPVLLRAGAVLGSDGDREARSLAAWSQLAAGKDAEALGLFQRLAKEQPADIAAWEGVRSAAEKLEDHTNLGVALARLGNACADDARAGAFWEKAGLVLLEHTDAHADAEIAFERALDRDPFLPVAFDKLFRRVRARNDDDRLLQLIEHRLEVTEDTAETTKMYWERARVLRRKGDQDGALQSLKDVTLLEPDHVGALALAGEICIVRAQFADAAPLLARLAGLSGAPKQQRVISGMAAVDLYYKKLKQPEKALDVLLGLHRNGLSTTKVRERLARLAAKVKNWPVAVSMFERLMGERDNSKGRADAARLAMTIYRDKLNAPEKAGAAVTQLLAEVPDDPDAIAMLLSTGLSKEVEGVVLRSAKQTLEQRLAENPCDLLRVKLLAELAEFEGNFDQQRSALGVLLALEECRVFGSLADVGADESKIRATVARYDARSAQQPEIRLDARSVEMLTAAGDGGSIQALFLAAAEAISAGIGPSQKTEGVGWRQRLDAGDPSRVAVARWMGALGLRDFDLYLRRGDGSKSTISGVAQEPPALVVGANLKVPFGPAERADVARAVLGLRMGSTAVLHFDDPTIASIVTALKNNVGVAVAESHYTVYSEVERAIARGMSRKLRKTVQPAAEAAAADDADAIKWAAAARQTSDRIALIASGDAKVVVEQIVGPPDAPGRSDLAENERAKALLIYALSSEYTKLRTKLGMGVK